MTALWRLGGYEENHYDESWFHGLYFDPATKWLGFKAEGTWTYGQERPEGGYQELLTYGPRTLYNDGIKVADYDVLAEAAFVYAQTAAQDAVETAWAQTFKVNVVGREVEVVNAYRPRNKNYRPCAVGEVGTVEQVDLDNYKRPFTVGGGMFARKVYYYRVKVRFADGGYAWLDAETGGNETFPVAGKVRVHNPANEMPDYEATYTEAFEHAYEGFVDGPVGRMRGIGLARILG